MHFVVDRGVWGVFYELLRRDKLVGHVLESHFQAKGVQPTRKASWDFFQSAVVTVSACLR